MGLFGKPAGQCCCGGGCTTGCCIPVDHTNPLYEPTGTPKDIPWSISAPGCAALDGITGTAVCGGAAPAVPGSCGICASCIGGDNITLSAMRYTEFPPPAGCATDSCSIVLCLSFQCVDSETDDPTAEACCKKFRLIVGCSELQVEDDPTINPFGGCLSFKKVAPISCVCAGNDSDFPAVVFPLTLNLAAPEFTGVCAPNLTGCSTLVSCDLTGATVVI